MKEVNLKLKVFEASDFEEAKALLGEEVYFISDIKNPDLDTPGVLDSIRFVQWTNDIFFSENNEAYSYFVVKS